MENSTLKLEKQVARLKQAVKKQRYGLVWMDVPDIENKLPILKEVPELAIKNDDGKPIHILIEGDNYHALTCLNYTHKGKIDVIYIDPPYNTGSDGFRYKDKRIINKFPDGTEVPTNHPFRHSYWLSFMRKRLELARTLLKDEGVIFVSIDDNEYSQLKLLLDEIFLPENFIANIIVKSNPRGKQQMEVAVTHEYVLVYANKIDKLTSFQNADLSDEQKNDYSKMDKNGMRYREMGLRKRGAASRRIDVPNLYYPVYIHPKSGEVSLEKTAQFKEVALPKLSTGEDGRWRWGRKLFEKQKNRLFGRLVNGSRWDIFEKDYLIREEKEKGTKYKSIWDEKELNYEKAKEELKKIFGGASPFEYPKTTYLIKKILKLAGKNNSLILDFFAGSGTTGHAVMDLNNEDKGRRQCILVTNNEVDKETKIKLEKQGHKEGDKEFDKEGICKKVCYPRIEKVINGYKYSGTQKKVLFEEIITLKNIEDSQEIIDKIDKIEQENEQNKEWNSIEKSLDDGILKVIGVRDIKGAMPRLGGSLKYYKTSFIGKNNILDATDSDKVELAHNAGELLAIAENTLELVKQNKYYQLFEDKNKEKYTAVYFREELDKFEEFVEMVEKLKKKTTVYVFSWGNEEFSDNFEHIKDIRVKTIPQPILEIYKSIYNLGVYDV
ncbi:MAG: site-specific DNA-methyltransferase [Candidatus Omnitrophica bacterium]|nr:site-specific DNA-methyltransferase [Candidatus Omnitrophota bacterium]